MVAIYHPIFFSPSQPKLLFFFCILFLLITPLANNFFLETILESSSHPLPHPSHPICHNTLIILPLKYFSAGVLPPHLPLLHLVKSQPKCKGFVPRSASGGRHGSCLLEAALSYYSWGLPLTPLFQLYSHLYKSTYFYILSIM